VTEGVNQPETDTVHPFGKHISWSEVFYFNFYDRDEDICAFMRIGLKPNTAEKSMFCYIMMPDRSVLGSRDQEHFSNNDLKVNGLTFERVRPEKEWRVKYSGAMKRTHGASSGIVDTSLDLTYLALNKTFDYRECGLWDKEFAPQMAADHTEQFGKIQGTLRTGDTELQLNGLGEKDHAWGVKDWTAPTTWIWLSCQFSESFAFNLTKLMERDVADGGFIHADGENRPITKALVNTECEANGAPKKLRIWFWEKNREVHQVEGVVLRYVKIPFTDTMERTLPVMYACLVRYRKGDVHGYGIAEYLTR